MAIKYDHDDSSSSSDEEDSSYYYKDYYYCKEEAIKPDWFTKLVLLQADLIHNALSSLLSPVVFLMSVLSTSYGKAEESALAARATLRAAPSEATRGAALLARKLGSGALGAVYVCAVLGVVLAVAVVLGVGLVRAWAGHEPVIMKERLHFDYTEVCPKSVFWLERSAKAVLVGVPMGHTFSVSVQMLMPESDFNRDVGVFQISAQLLTTNGHVMARSSLPCMLRFRSLPVRLARTFLLSVPLLLGIVDETQRITITDVLKHREVYPRSEAISIRMSPRAGTNSLPQIYEAQIVLKSKLPWPKELVRRWKWTFYVWTSLYIFVVLVFGLLFFCRHVFFPTLLLSSSIGDGGEDRGDQVKFDSGRGDDEGLEEEEHSDSEFVRKWTERRGKRKAVFYMEAETGGSAASSLTVSREETAEEEEEVGDSESVC